MLQLCLVSVMEFKCSIISFQQQNCCWAMIPTQTLNARIGVRERVYKEQAHNASFCTPCRTASSARILPNVL